MGRGMAFGELGCYFGEYRCRLETMRGECQLNPVFWYCSEHANSLTHTRPTLEV